MKTKQTLTIELVALLLLLSTGFALPAGYGYKISPADVVIDPVAEARLKDAEPFRLLGPRSASAKIVNKAGDVVLEADPKVGIYDCSVSPNGKRIAVYFASEGSLILDPETGEKILLPKRPPGENKFI